MLQVHEIANPKRHLDPEEVAGRKLFPYYAGFSGAFVESTLSLLNLPCNAKVLDPWNGSGTTTVAAFRRGLTAIGSDLNPAMALVAKAAFVSRLDVESLIPLAHSIIDKVDDGYEGMEEDPLGNWFHPRSVSLVRGIEERINRTLISHGTYTHLDSPNALEKVTPLAAFFYLALFRVTRRWAQGFAVSNPTWIRVAKNTKEKKHLTRQGVSKLFIQEVKLLCERRERFPIYRDTDANRLQLLLANAEDLPLEKESIDAIITSPPYCTRIDYAVATYTELAVLRIGGVSFSTLRRALTGSSTVQKNSIGINPEWGHECGNFLRAVYEHPSKASKTYYFKNHSQYFDSFYKSLSEAARVLAPKAPCTLVVQNSYYKEIRNDIAVITSQMAENLAMSLVRQADFSASRSMVEVNQRSKKYIGNRSTIESVLFFRKS
ncbi:DNA methylase [Nitrosospira briensis]|uniref:DNA methylase n=1 Tax=Nitrosospira briensis TaxID=35799 RepID=UPI000469CD77|nr:DNA methylase [Nitrosospira briensis]